MINEISQAVFYAINDLQETEKDLSGTKWWIGNDVKLDIEFKVGFRCGSDLQEATMTVRDLHLFGTAGWEELYRERLAAKSDKSQNR